MKTNNQKLWEIITKIFKLPAKCTYFNLEMSFYKEPEITIKHILDSEDEISYINHNYTIHLEENNENLL